MNGLSEIGFIQQRNNHSNVALIFQYHFYHKLVFDVAKILTFSLTVINRDLKCAVLAKNLLGTNIS